jgi:hypothetical protein
MSDHRTCVQHLYDNFRNDGNRGVLLKDKLWKIAAAYTEAECLTHMEELKQMNQKAYDYLAKVDPRTWCRAYFHTYSKCDLLVNNLCESWNAYILKFRDKPILHMFEGIRKKLMRRYQVKKEGIKAMKGKFGPRIVEKIEAEGDKAAYCTSTYAGNGLFEVDCKGKSFVVDLGKKTCSCRKWEMVGIPCAHAFSAILYDGGNPEDYVDHYYSKEMYLKAYEPIVCPVPSEEQWVKTDMDNIEPPKYRVAPGRPKKARKRGPDEPKNPNRIRKGGITMQCSRCRKVGHNTRTCPVKKRQDAIRKAQRNWSAEHVRTNRSLDNVS